RRRQWSRHIGGDSRLALFPVQYIEGKGPRPRARYLQGYRFRLWRPYRGGKRCGRHAFYRLFAKSIGMSDVIPVFLIDDDKDLLKETRQTLELAGFIVSIFSTAADALKLLGAEFSGVVVSDIRMPHIDGLQLFDRIRRLDEDLPVILVTGHGDIPMAVKAIQD